VWWEKGGALESTSFSKVWSFGVSLWVRVRLEMHMIPRGGRCTALESMVQCFLTGVLYYRSGIKVGARKMLSLLNSMAYLNCSTTRA